MAADDKNITGTGQGGGTNVLQSQSLGSIAPQSSTAPTVDALIRKVRAAQVGTQTDPAHRADAGVKSTSGKSRFPRMFRPRGKPNTQSEAGAPPKLPKAVYVSSLFINLLGLALPMVMLQVYDRILPNEATETLTMLVLGMVGVMILDTAMKMARAYMVGWVTARHHFEMVSDAVSRILHAPGHLMQKDVPSVHLDRLNALETMREFYGGQSRLLLLDLPFIVIFLGLMAFIGGFLVLVPIAMFAVLGTYSIRRGVSLRKVLESRAMHDDRRYDFIIESLLGIQTVKLMAMEPQLQRRFERLQKVGAEASYGTILLGNQAQITGNLFSNLTMIGVVSVGAYMVIQGQLSMGVLAACSLLSGRTIQPLLRGLGLWTQIQTISIARGRVETLFQLPAAPEGELPVLDALAGSVELKQVSFAYDTDEPFVLKDLDLAIAPGEMIGLRGGDGSGKSTLVKLLRGELSPTAGEVKIDGHEISGPMRPALCDWLAIVPQNASLFQGTILENITMFRTGDAIDHAREACRLIGLETEVHRLPEGYDTKVSEGIGDELPAGMLQRIVIARALARKPKFLLFDEGNSSLDSSSDRLLREGFAVLKGSMTIFLVSQRPSLLRVADRVYALEDGKLRDAMADYVETPAAQSTGQAGSGQPVPEQPAPGQSLPHQAAKEAS